MNSEEYEKSILEWRKNDDAKLRGENGWLALAGLFWLNEGPNTAGSDSACDILLPPRAPASFGTFEFDGKNVSLRVADGLQAEVNGRSVKRAVLKSRQDPKPSFITFDGLRMVVHKHNGRYAIRIWDNLSPERESLAPREWYPIDQKYCFRATYTRFKEPVKANLPNVFGDVEEWQMTGQLVFEFNGQTHALDVTEQDDGSLFVQFKDSTQNTYPPGRYVYAQPEKGTQYTLDFNIAHNPPCVFTPFATCAFAPKQNHLKAAIEAGEIYTNKH
ncbi:MAG: DUF1684 domain-containing protein [Chloroflexi bacterium]|nr:DUF1684 domain-containing protein [Chloroflexota bacterium]